MFDGSRLSYEENVAVTADVVRHVPRRGVDVEAELGEVGGKDGVHAPGARTGPDEATEFVAAHRSRRARRGRRQLARHDRAATASSTSS